MDFFNELKQLSKKYDYDHNHNLRYVKLAKIINNYNVKKLLILGCGKGILEYVLPDYISCFSIDVDEKSLKIARDINVNKKNRTFTLDDMFEILKNANDGFDGIVISEVIEHLKDDVSAIMLARKFLEPCNGLLFLTVPNINRIENKIKILRGRKIKFMAEDHLREYTLEKVYNLLSHCGFKNLYTGYVFLRFIKEMVMRKIIPLESPIRKCILKLKPHWGTWIITVSVPAPK